MEHWNTTNTQLYECFFDNFTQNQYSLEQAQFLSYVEMYSNTNNACSYIRNAKYSPKAPLSKIVENLDASWHPSFAQHKRLYRDTINQILSCTLDGLSLDICIDPQTKGKKTKAYAITKEDLFFFNFLFVTHQAKDAKHLITGGDDNYAKISDDYYEHLKFGVKNLIATHPSNYTNEDIEFCFEYKFGKAKRHLLSKLEYLNQITKDLADFSWDNKELLSTYKQCESVIEEAESKLMLLRSNFFDNSGKHTANELEMITKDIQAG